MTDLLKDMLQDRADTLGAPDLDVLAMVRQGDGRATRRRTAVVGGVAAAAVVATLGGSALVAGGGDSAKRVDHVADGTNADPRPLSWTTGSTVHRTGEADLELGSEVRTWVWAGDAVAFIDTGRRVQVWDDGEIRSVGTATADDPDPYDVELVADGSRVAWVDEDQGLTVLDLADGSVRSLALPTSAIHAGVTAIDGHVAYAVDDRGAFSWDFGTEQDHVIVLDDDPAHRVLDSENGTLLQVVGEREARVSGPGRDITLTVDNFANLSPSGAFVMAESDDEGILLDTSTGDRMSLDTGFPWAVPYQWLDDDTVAVLGFRSPGKNREIPFLLGCRVSTGVCDGPGVALPAEALPAEIGPWQLPLGFYIDAQ